MNISTEPPITYLTPRELEALHLIWQGAKTRQIAVTMKIGEQTVNTYRHQMKIKLRAHNTAELIAAAMRLGLIRPPTAQG